jgi:antitoxin (DNA-binding transcriptional repressor) of toxin-antitoxin stability system
MLTKTVNVDAEQGLLKELLSQVLAGTEIVLLEGGAPVARLVPLTPRTAGLHAGAIWTGDDFDEPLPDEFWTEGA